MFKTFCAYLTICSLVTSQLAALPPGTGETELTNMPAAAVSSSSTSTAHSAAALEGGARTPAAVTPDILPGVTSSAGANTVGIVPLAEATGGEKINAFNAIAIELPIIKTILNQHTVGANKDRVLMGQVRNSLRSIDLVYCRAQSATILILGLGFLIFCVYASRMAGDVHRIADDMDRVAGMAPDLHSLAASAQGTIVISQNNSAILQNILENLAKRP